MDKQPSRGVLSVVGSAMQRLWNNLPKAGVGHASAMWRSGFKEISQILKAFPESVGIVEEPGLAGNPTSYEVSKNRGNTTIFDSRVQEARERVAQQSPPEQELSR